MKTKVLGCLLLACIMTSAGAQFRNIPPEVTDSFRTRYTNAKHVEWKDKLTSFQASFEQNNEKATASYSSKGQWLKTEKALKAGQLPPAVKDGFDKSKYANYTVQQVTEIDDHEKGHTYKVVVKKGSITRRNLVFTDSGQLVKDDMNF